MKRRTMLGLAATALAGTRLCEQRASAEPTPAPRVRNKIGHVLHGGNNYEWTDDNARRGAQMLALTVMLFNGRVKSGKEEGLFYDFKNHQDQTKLPPNHPMLDLDSDLYTRTWTYCDTTGGWSNVFKELRTAAKVMQKYANIGFGVTNVKPVGPKRFAYTSPDKCPCGYGDPTQPDPPDCPPVDPLL
jgi:hypothetical protein